MAELTVTLSANAGVSLEFGTHRIWIDALHTQKVPGFSCVDKPLQGKMLCSSAFQEPEWMIFTHCHPDHFSKELTLAAKKLYPNAKLALPETQFPQQLLITGERAVCSWEDVEITFLKLPHAGAQYANVAHYGVLISWQGKQILLSGDSIVANSVLANAVSGMQIDVAILNFPWLTLPAGEQFVQQVIRPKHWIVNHVPFEGDDVNDYRSVTESAVARLQRKVHVLDAPLQSVQLEI